MKCFVVKPLPFVRGKVNLLGDKSIAHRCVIISAISRGKTIIRNFPVNKDCLATIKAFQALGIKIILNKQRESSLVTVFGKGLRGLTKPDKPIFVGDSGTTLRLILGVLAGQDFTARLLAGKSLSKRPMLRVNAPLRRMGAKINAKCKILPQKRDSAICGKNSKLEEFPPIRITGAELKPISYKIPVASAQVKSAILFAGLYAGGRTRVIEPIKTRDHTERMLKLFQADIKIAKNRIAITAGKELVSPGELTVPSDISSAAFFIVLASIMPDSCLLLKDISLNPSRTGIIRVLRRMGANIRESSIENRASSIEPRGDITVKSSHLKATVVKKNEIPSLIDELPILMVAACFAKGRTVFEGIQELRVKETDRIKSMSDNLKKMGAKIRILKAAKSEKMLIEGVPGLKGAKVKSFGDHRTAMSMVIAGIKAEGHTFIDDISCIDKSFPCFLRALKRLSRP